MEKYGAKSKKELLNIISIMDEKSNPFRISQDILSSLEDNSISYIESQLLFGTLYMECKQLKLPTSNKNCFNESFDIIDHCKQIETFND